MNIFPHPLLCLYCDAQIIPNTVLGCKKHMYRCRKHPAVHLLAALEKIAVSGDIGDARLLAEEALLCEI